MEFRTDKNILYINLEGKIDATNASEFEEKINEIRNANQGMHTVLDADNLEYISSAGLRVMLRLRKSESDLAIINVSPEVYSVFERKKLLSGKGSLTITIAWQPKAEYAFSHSFLL